MSIFKQIIKYKLQNTEIFFVLFLSFFISFITCYFATPTIFGGRDQGSIATAAIELVKNKSFSFSAPLSEDLFQKYGPGKALNYPGFNYTREGELITRFPKAYIAYLAIFYAILGLKGLQYANFLPLGLFLFLFWLTLRRFFSEKISFLGFLVAATFFPFLWFAKYTLTEIFTLFLIWTGIYFLISCRRPTSKLVDVGRLQVSLVAFALSALTRIEGIIFFALAVIYILLLDRKKIFHLPKNLRKFLLLSTLFLATAYVFLNFPALSDSLKNVAKTFLPNSTKDSTPSPSLYLHLLRLFFNYNILVYLVLGLTGIFLIARKIKENWSKPEFLVIFILFPSFFYLISPLISLDDPWMLRRFVFAVFPALIFYSVYFLNRFFYHKIFLYLTLSTLIAANSFLSWRFIPLSENKDFLPQVEKIFQKFGPDDLILVDRLAAGSGFSLLSEPLRTILGKNAVYFFNAEDLPLIDRSKYKNIYLAVSEEENKSWYTHLEKTPAGSAMISNNFLEPSQEIFGLPVNIEYRGKIIFWKVK